jgi:hypothetical protein
MKYLGFLFGWEINQEGKNVKLLNQIKSNILQWKGKKIVINEQNINGKLADIWIQFGFFFPTNI